jgi:4-alpha-glucanotransferase
MRDEALVNLARTAGLAPEWWDIYGNHHIVPEDTLRSVLRGLGLPADSEADIAESRLKFSTQTTAPLQTARAGERVSAGATQHAVIHFENGSTAQPDLDVTDQGTFLTAPSMPGYHTIETDQGIRPLAIAPHCHTIADTAPGRKLTGLGVQIYALRGTHSAGFGDLGHLADFAECSAAFGVDAVTLNPLHALFLAAPENFGPYSPSTRLFLNPLYADTTRFGIESAQDVSGDAIVDWPRAGKEKVRALRAAFARFKSGPPPDDFNAFRTEQGTRLILHARFEALDAHFRSRGLMSWPDWPKAFQEFASPEVETFARENADEVDFHIFLQWLCDASLATAQKRARNAGMAIGLILDIAVGMNPRGSHAWSSPNEVLRGVSVGAPPDLINQQGQNWGLTALSPTGLKQTGYAGFIATLRAGMRHAGGVRIDHAMGLCRLWLVPDGASVAEGVYLHYPMQDLLNIVALESHRHRAIVIGEDLGTVPDGFREAMAQAGMMGMDVLWFQREGERFLSPDRWHRHNAAMSTTHDLPTIAGWWSGHDIEWREKLGWISGHDALTQERDLRAGDRWQLWSALRDAGCADEDPPPPENPAPAVEAALDFVGCTPCEMAIVPMEDILNLQEQPNIPGTIHEHPNWQRRFPPGDLFASPQAEANLTRLRRARSKS